MAIFLLALRFPGAEFASFNPATLIGAVMFVSGVALRAAAIHQLGTAFTSDVTVGAEKVLECSGLYRIVRHPSETGLLLVGLGSVFYFQSPAALPAWCVVLALTLRRIRLEDRCLATAFGKSFAHYRHQVGALLPRLPVVLLLHGGAR